MLQVLANMVGKMITGIEAGKVLVTPMFPVELAQASSTRYALCLHAAAAPHQRLPSQKVLRLMRIARLEAEQHSVQTRQGEGQQPGLALLIPFLTALFRTLEKASLVPSEERTSPLKCTVRVSMLTPAACFLWWQRIPDLPVRLAAGGHAAGAQHRTQGAA